jgi:hypothetical protein
MMRDRAAPHINFEDLQGLLGNILPSNIDMVLERKGHVLIGEWKRPKEKLSKGQEILLKSLARKPKFTVIIVTGDTDSHMSVERYWKIHQDGTPKLTGYGLDSFKDFIVDWYLVADTFEEGHPVTM